MGAKSRGSWNLNFCMRTNCKNRGVKCAICIKFNEFVSNNVEEIVN